MMNIYLIRHGRQCIDLCNVNVPLCDAGKRQAALLGTRLLGYHIDKIYSSDLIRAVETAQIINESFHVEHEVIPAFREISFGDLEGLSDDEIKERFGDFTKRRKLRLSDEAYPGGECGRDVYERAMPEILKITEQKEENVAIITHGGLIRAILAGILGDDFSVKLAFAKDLENCSITQLRYEKEEKQFYIERVNDFAHLEAEESLLRKHFKKGF